MIKYRIYTNRTGSIVEKITTSPGCASYEIISRKENKKIIKKPKVKKFKQSHKDFVKWSDLQIKHTTMLLRLWGARV